MAKQLYTLSRADNNYFNGHDLHVCKIETGETITVNRKQYGLLAVCVKDEGTIHNEPANVREAARKLGDEATNVIYELSVERYWTWAHMDLAGNHGFEGVSAAGHSGGWLAVSGTDSIEDGEITESPAPDSPWGRFLALAFEAIEEIETYRAEWRREMIKAAARLNEWTRGEGDELRPPETAASEPIQVFAVTTLGDGGEFTTSLHRNKVSLMSNMGTEFEGAATTALNSPGEAVPLNAGGRHHTFVTYLTVVE